MLEYSIGVSIFSLVLYLALRAEVSSDTLNIIQIAAIILCNYAIVPQVFLTFRTKKASWSPITAAMSVAGNLIRIFTTIQLTGDLLVLSGFTLGFVSNLVLLLQVLYYGKSK